MAEASVAQLAQVLSGLKAVDTDKLSKFSYPSAGRIYAVRTYIIVTKATDGLVPGVYYFHPLQNMLVPVMNKNPLVDENKYGAYLLFSFNKTHIEHVYGKDAGLGFALLEAGYMKAVLQTTSAQAEIQLVDLQSETVKLSEKEWLEGGQILHVAGINPATK
eukprot:TRINITY_DN18719_c0_g1_i1.p1 TRINITY_DN18719_c0_g1~~TRINITY_DN18719_c0_g1_i1.p1  ORF type:complete len:161 (+),score=36.81 TRINITY_DN18719_c0_g1_i1:85-567(+)